MFAHTVFTSEGLTIIQVNDGDNVIQYAINFEDGDTSSVHEYFYKRINGKLKIIGVYFHSSDSPAIIARLEKLLITQYIGEVHGNKRIQRL